MAGAEKVGMKRTDPVGTQRGQEGLRLREESWESCGPREAGVALNDEWTRERLEGGVG